MTRLDAIQSAKERIACGDFFRILARRVACVTESQQPDNGPALRAYLENELRPDLEKMGFTCRFLTTTSAPDMPFMLAEYIEDPALPTLLSYGHGDVVFGDEKSWDAGRDPWQLVAEGDRLYGRGSADNKGQHTLNLMALEQVFRARGGKLGFNCKILFEMGEEIGSPGLAELCREHAGLLAADLFIASDGPRLNASRPTLFLGSRGCANFRLTLRARDRAHHSGNWGGLLSNPGTQLMNAIATLVDGRGKILIDALRPPNLTADLHAILQDIEPGGNPGDPQTDPCWGEPGLTASEKLLGWNAFEVLSFITGNPDKPVNAIPASATAVCQLRFVVGTETLALVEHLGQHLSQQGYPDIEISLLNYSPATRFDPQSPLVNWALDMMETVSGKKPALLPNLGGSLPNDVFAEILGLPTLWIPHSYPSCGQHAPNEHLLSSVVNEGMAIMTGLFWALGEQGKDVIDGISLFPNRETL